jgi:hypothetical protein
VVASTKPDDELAGSPASPAAKAEIKAQLDAWEADYRKALDEFLRQKQDEWKSPRFKE